MTSQPLVISVILNTNRRDDTLECLVSLSRNSYSNHKIIVLDNASTDGSVEAIRAAHPAVQFVALERNLGYAGNNNVGIELALQQGADWVFVLNEDIILDAECLAKLIEVGERDPQIGILGPLVYHHDEPTVIQSAGGMLGKYWESIHLGKNEADNGQFKAPHPVEWISGCAILVRRKAIEQAGMLDANYFIYWEETEWCIRVGRAGWKIMHVPQARIWHKGVQRDYQPKPSFTYYGTRNYLLTLSKHKAPLHVRLYVWLQILRTFTSWSIKPKWRHKREHRDAMWQGIRDYLRGRWGRMPSS
ncbi:MAG: glycosyltransferase family 2 protein [Anaerolineales bacterium]|nr:MAG: glycosyltransferase family 2 protein [Anaerolineales bacterium]